MCGRLHKANLSFECKHPPIIPIGHHITELIIKDATTNYITTELNKH